MATVIVLAILTFALPIRVRDAADAPLLEHCLQVADRPPAHNDQAYLELERCSVVVPGDVELLADLGGAYEVAGRRPDAERAYQKALMLDPDYADVRIRLASLMWLRGAASDAHEHASHALRVQPNRKAVRDLLEAIERSHAP